MNDDQKILEVELYTGQINIIFSQYYSKNEVEEQKGDFEKMKRINEIKSISLRIYYTKILPLVIKFKILHPLMYALKNLDRDLRIYEYFGLYENCVENLLYKNSNKIPNFITIDTYLQENPSFLTEEQRRNKMDLISYYLEIFFKSIETISDDDIVNAVKEEFTTKIQEELNIKYNKKLIIEKLNLSITKKMNKKISKIKVKFEEEKMKDFEIILKKEEKNIEDAVNKSKNLRDQYLNLRVGLKLPKLTS